MLLHPWGGVPARPLSLVYLTTKSASHTSSQSYILKAVLATGLISCGLFSVEMDPKERLARQRKLLQKKLGLDMGAAIGMDTEELFNDEDLDYTCQNSGLRGHGSKVAAGSSSRNHTVRLVLASSL